MKQLQVPKDIAHELQEVATAEGCSSQQEALKWLLKTHKQRNKELAIRENIW